MHREARTREPESELTNKEEWTNGMIMRMSMTIVTSLGTPISLRAERGVWVD